MTLETQFATLVAMISFGALFGASFDVYNRFLKRSKRRSWFVFINDLLFWCCQALLIFYILFKTNQGELRFFLFLALLCGYAAYQALFRTLFLKLLETVITLINNIFLLCTKLVSLILIRPIKWLGVVLVGLVLFCLKIIGVFGKGLLSLAKWPFKAILSIIRALLYPFSIVFRKLSGLIPKRYRDYLKHFLELIKGKCSLILNYISKTWSKWTNRSK